MRRFLTVSLAPALPVLVAIAVVGACGGDPTADRQTSADTPSTEAPSRATQAKRSQGEVTTTSPPTTTANVPAEPAATDATSLPDEPGYACSDGGMDEAIALQQGFEEGHQPWRASPEMVAEAGAACVLGSPERTIEPAGNNRYLATDLVTGEQVIVEIAQPFGPGTIWLVTGVAAS